MSYSKAKIYKLVNTIDDEIYVGSTISSLAKRMAKHRWTMRNIKEENCKLHIKMNELGQENFRILLFENYPCNSVEELRKREGEYIKDLKASLNYSIAGRSYKEWTEDNKEYKKQHDKNYYEINKEKILEQCKIYREAHREEKLARDKNYYQRNKEKLLMPVKCECGQTVSKSWLSRHRKTICHQNNLKYTNE